MSTASSSPCPADVEYARRVAAAIRGIGLVGVLKGFARSVMGLGLAMSDVVARLTQEGADPFSANAGFDLKGAMTLLRRALFMVDALRTRLRTPAVSAALKRPRPSRAGSARRPPTGSKPTLGETMAALLFLRRNGEVRREWRQAIADLTDREVLAHIYHDLKDASAILGDTTVVARIEKLARVASAWLEQPADYVPPKTAARRPAEPVTPEVGPAPTETAQARPPHANGRGPP